MSHSLCNRCDHYSACLLNYDGKPCRELRSVEPTHADMVRDADNTELASLMAAACVKAVKAYIMAGKPEIGSEQWDWLADEIGKINRDWLEEECGK